MNKMERSVGAKICKVNGSGRVYKIKTLTNWQTEIIVFIAI